MSLTGSTKSITKSNQHSIEPQAYYPLAESRGGWRWLDSANDVRKQAGMDADKLAQLFKLQTFLFGNFPAGIVIIRNGYLVCEHHTFMSLATSRYDIWSCTKSLTGLAWGLLLDDFENDRQTHDSGQIVDLDTPACSLIPEAYPPSDLQKEWITIRHLLTMTSGIAGESMGVYGIPTTTGSCPFEHALGRCPNRYGKSVDQLATKPGTKWDYSDPAMALLSLIFANIAG